MEDQEGFRDALLGAGVLVATGVDGVFGRSAAFEGTLSAIDRCVEAAAADQDATYLRFPPVLPAATIEQTDYLRSFPDLLGAVHSFTGGDREHRDLVDAVERGDDWGRHLASTDLVLCPAACYPLYPMSAGTLPSGGRRYDILGWIFRHEPSRDPARMQMFRQHEVVYLGDRAGAFAHRDAWIDRGLSLLGSLGLPVEAVIANDPFFGRAGRLLAAGQREEALKYELVVPIASDEHPTAITSCNCHLDHFGRPFGITTADGEVADTACVGFGLERITLALFRHHGMDPAQWPTSVRDRLWP